MRTFVKFCGITDPSVLEEVRPEEGAIGLVVEVPRSPRTLTVERAREIAEAVPPPLEVWAVLVDPPTDLVHEAFDTVGVDWVQLHGTIPGGLDAVERHRIIPSVPIPSGPEPPVLPPAFDDADFRRIHIDTADGERAGGTGRPPHWPTCAQLVDRLAGRKAILAGGLTPETVGEAIRTVRPWGVDVSTGIESRPGVKDPERMRRFLEAVRAAEEARGA
ncbi:MAG: phosphoribosylanthranilate isomerase [Thermoplasmata archaeon]